MERLLRARLRNLALSGVALVGCAANPPPAAKGTPAPAALLAASALRADVPLPDSPVGHAAAEWLHAFNDASREETLAFYKARYAPALLAVAPAEDRRDTVHQLRATEGRRHVRAIEHASETQIVMLLEAEIAEISSRVTMEVDPAPPHAIVKSSTEAIGFGPAAAPPGDDTRALAMLDAYVTRMCDRGVFSGAVEVARGGNAVYTRACGLASRAFDAPNRVDTKFNLGSMNKMFTAVSIAQLVDAGKLSYSDTLAKAWPEYPNRAVAEKITIHQLLTHASGLGDYFTDEYERMSKDKLRAIKDYLPLFADKPLLFEPGSRFKYSNAGFMVLGGVVQRVSGEDYFDYVRAHVYAPAGMKNTDAFELDHDTPNLAIGYTINPEAPGKVQNNLFLHVVKGGPAGGGFSTVGDLVAFGQALEHGKLVSPAQVTTLTTSRDGMDPGYGSGFTVETFRGVRQIGHSGGFPGINAHLSVFPESGLSIATMANADPPSAELVADYARDVLVPLAPEHAQAPR